MTEADALVADASLSMPEREERLAAAWSALADRGASRALQTLADSDSAEAMALAARYLALLPGHRADKQHVVESLASRRGEWARAITELIRFLPAGACGPLVRQALEAPEDPSTPSLLFELAGYFPACVQPFAELIDDPLVGGAMLPGGPDGWVDAFLGQFEQSEDPIHLRALVRMRTPRARTALQALRRRAPPRMWPALDACIENCGSFGDSDRPSYLQPAALAFVVDRGEAPHRVGGGFHGRLPCCELCGAPTGHLLTLSAGELGWPLSRDPSFLWFQCGCHDRDTEALFVQLDADGARRLVIIEFDLPSRGGRPFLLGERALALEPHPNPIGIGSDRVPQRARHEVGGPPNWCRMDAFPRCPVCSGGMVYLAALDGGMTPFGRLRIPGTLFLFWCDGCAVAATRLQR